MTSSVLQANSKKESGGHSLIWRRLICTAEQGMVFRDSSLKGQCPDFAHARASSVFSSKDNRTVILTWQDFLPNHTADGDLLFIFSSNTLDFLRNLSSYLKFGSRHEDLSRFYRLQGRLATRKSLSARLKTDFLMWNSRQRSVVPSPVISAWLARVLASNVGMT